MYRIIDMGSKICFLLMLMITIPVIFEGQFILDIWLKTPPEHSARLVALVLIAININSFTFFQYQGVHATGKIASQQIWMSSTFIANIAIIYFVFKMGASFEAALYVNMIISAVQCVINLYYAHQSYDYDVKKFLRNILLPCLIVAAIVVAAMLGLTLNLDPSVGRFFLVLVVSELMIVGLGYFILLDYREKELVTNFVVKNIQGRKK